MGDPAVNAQRQRQLPPGSILGRYRVLKRIAAGGMAEVYVARPEGVDGLARPVALKLVLPHLAEDPKFVELFEHEARIALRVGHPNIAQVLELQRDGDEIFLVMEFVDGHSLQAMLGRSQGPLSLPCALSLIIATCGAIHHAHEARKPDGTRLELVHRDISPSNVMIRHDGVVKVVDFGIAKALAETGLTKTGSLKGKSGYMSPEQCRGQRLTRASDIFNLGILLYETTTGRRAFGGSNMFAVMNKIVDGRYARPSAVVSDYPAELEAIVRRALSMEPTERHPTALALRDELQAFASARGILVSEQAIADELEALMGPAAPLEPSLLEMPIVAPEAPLERRRLPAWAKTAGIGVLAGATAFVVLRGSQQNDAAEAVVSKPAPIPDAATSPPEPRSAADPEPEDQPVAAGAPEPAPPPGVTPEGAEPKPPEEKPPEEKPPEEKTTGKSKKRGKSKKSKSKSTSKKRDKNAGRDENEKEPPTPGEQSGDEEGLFPWKGSE